MAYKKVKYIIHVVHGTRFRSRVDATFWENSFTHLMKVKHFLCKKSIDNAEFIILMGWVYVSENSFQLMLQSWLSNRETQIQSHTEKMHNITYTWNKSCILFYISIGKYCYKSSKQSIIYACVYIYQCLYPSSSYCLQSNWKA